MSKPRPAAKKPAGRKRPAAGPKPVTVYAVARSAGYGRGATGDPERVFADRAAAEAYAAGRSRACRPFLNPFGSKYCDPGYLITGGEKKLAAAVTKLGLRPPAKRKGEVRPDWFGWWDRAYADLSEAQRDGVWDALDKLELYRVEKTTLEG